jgi:hypothetical protein
MTTNTWTQLSGSGYLWEDAANWSLGHAPLATEDAVLTGSADIGYDSGAQCKTLDASTFTGTLNHAFLQIKGPGTVTLGASSDFSNTRFAFNGSGAITLNSNWVPIGGLIISAGVSVTLTSAMQSLGGWSGLVNNGTMNLGNFDITVYNGVTMTGANAWTWGTGKLRMQSGSTISGSSANLGSPSMPPVVMEGAGDLGTGDIRVASIDETSFVLARNGFTVFDPSNNPILPPSTTTNWTGGASDNQWDSAGNWDNGVPTSSLDAVITGSGLIQTNSEVNAKSIDFTGFTGTFDQDTVGNDVYVYGNLTLANGMTFAGYTFIGFKGSGTLIRGSAAASDLELAVMSPGVTCTLGDNGAAITAMTVYGGVLALGTRALTISQYLEIKPTDGLTWSPGATILINVPDSSGANIIINENLTLPPTTVTGGTSSGCHIGNASAGTEVPGTVHFTSLSLTDVATLANDTDYETTGDLTFSGVTTSAAYVMNWTVGGNFSATDSTIGGTTTRTFTVTGTAVAHNTTVTNCDFSGGTELDATDGCTNGLGNTNVDFGVQTSTTACLFLL